MKRNISFFLSIFVVVTVLSVTLILQSNHIPLNVGGHVDVEEDMGMVSAPLGRLVMLQKLSQQLKKHPDEQRFRLFSRWDDGGVSGGRAVVYDRSTHDLLTWSEGHNQRHWFSRISRTDYIVPESALLSFEGMDVETWMGNGRRFVDFDFIQNYGGMRRN